eukprot:scaffold8041_cov129-Skeletonema_marinoi.AAC.4
MAVSEGAAAFHQSSLSLAALMSKKFCSVDKRDKRYESLIKDGEAEPSIQPLDRLAKIFY